MSFVLITAFLVFISDQGTKLWVSNVFSEGVSRPVLPGIFHLTLITNTGSAFGLFPNGGAMFIVFSILAIVILISIILKNGKNFSVPVKISCGFLLGGICGNLTDRLRFGAVVDFLDFRIWPVFNLADSAITLAVVFLSFHILRKKNAPHTL